MWKRVIEAIETHADELESLDVSPPTDPEITRTLLERVDFDTPMSVEDALSLTLEGLRHHQVHNGHPRYFGLFNSERTDLSVAADALVAAFNPQLAAWTHAPFACEVEQRLIREIGARFGYDEHALAGSFTSGGAEANHTALLMALTRRFPRFPEDGALALPGKPVLYVSSESHHSFLKASRLVGIGSSAVKAVGVDASFRMDPQQLSAQIRLDRERGDIPFMVVATLGTTGAGLVDPVGAIVEIGESENLWVHADAAWGGAAALTPEMAAHFRGIERADSITFDAHKWLGMPMAAGMFFTRHPDLPERTFSVTAGYMPVAEEGARVIEPHRNTMQWTRRFIGLKLFLTMLVAGFEGYRETITRMIRLGDTTRKKLADADWTIVNDTPLPVICFQDARVARNTFQSLSQVAESVVASGRAWVSMTSLGGRVPAIRACITNFRNREEDVDALIELLSEAR